MDTAAILRQARRDAGMTQVTMAERAGVRPQTVCQYERGGRTPSIRTLVALLAAAGRQMRITLEPLDADVHRLIESLRETGAARAKVVAIWSSVPDLAQVDHRVEGVAAAAILGAPVPVQEVELAFADTEATFHWIAMQVRRYVVHLRAPGEVSTFEIPWTDDRAHDGRVARRRLAEVCPDGRFLIEGPFDCLRVRLVPEAEIVDRVQVVTHVGPIAVQPLDDIVCHDDSVARVLRVLRESRG